MCSILNSLFQLLSSLFQFFFYKVQYFLSIFIFYVWLGNNFTVRLKDSSNVYKKEQRDEFNNWKEFGAVYSICCKKLKEVFHTTFVRYKYEFHLSITTIVCITPRRKSLENDNICPQINKNKLLSDKNNSYVIHI